MNKHIKLATSFFLFCFTIFLLSSCNNDDKDKKKTDALTTDAKGPVSNALTPGKLDTLNIARLAFDNMPMGSKLYFSFTFSPTNKLTLDGWREQAGADKFTPLPNIKLNNGNPGNLNYGLGTYFGNVVLTANEFNKIKTALVPGMNYVLFAPVLIGNNIGYKIFVTDKLSDSKTFPLVVAPTGAEANPSPPKND